MEVGGYANGTRLCSGAISSQGNRSDTMRAVPT